MEKTPKRSRRAESVVYPSVAAHFHTTPRRAEDGMRRAIDAAWTLGNIERQYALFGNTIDDTRGKPTTAALLATVAEFFRQGEDSAVEPSPPCAEGMSDSASGEG